MPKMKLALAVSAIMGLTTASKAFAWVQFCNSTNVTIWTTYSWHNPSCSAVDGSVWEKQGWWSLTPGECKIVYGPTIGNSISYYYAEGSGITWSGPFGDCTPWAAFDLCDNTCNTNARVLGYRELNTGGFENYTLTFTR
jgi:uncharacterized membrane protein